MLNIINLRAAHNLRNLCTDLLHIGLKFLFIETKLENLNLSTHIVVGNTLLIESQTSLIRVHISTKKSVFKAAGLILKKITSVRMPVVDLLMFRTRKSISSLTRLKLTQRSLSKSLFSKKLVFHLNLGNLCIHHLSLHSKTKIIRKGTIINIRSRPGSGTGHLRLIHVTGTTIHKIRI